MAKEDVSRLFRAVQSNPALKEQLNLAPNLESFVQMAREYGYDLTVAEWQEVTGYNVEELQGELSDIPGI